MQERQVNNAATFRRVNELAGRIAIMTGRTSGIGLGIAQAFAATGIQVRLSGSPTPRMDAPRNCLGVGGDEIAHSILDLMYAKAPYTMLGDLKPL